MGRITRKQAAEAAEALNIDEDAVLELDEGNENLDISKIAKELHRERPERAPLGELAPNSVDGSSQSDDPILELKKSTRGKKGSKKGAKGKKANLAASLFELPDIIDTGDALPRADDSTASPVSEMVADDLLKDIPASTPVEESATTQSPANATTLSDSELATLEAEPKSLVDGIGQTREEREALQEEVTAVGADEGMAHTPALEGSERRLPLGQLSNDAPASPLPTAVPKTIANLRKDTPVKRSASNKENVEPEDTESPQTLTLDVTDSIVQPSPSTPQDPITALDDLDEAVDSVTKDIPDVQTSPQKPKVKTESKKPAPVVRGTKASQARISLAQNTDAPSKTSSLGQPRPSTTTTKSNSVRSGATSKPDPTARRVASGNSTNSGKAGAERERKEVVIPHSKPRPVSISFPTPPPPTKSTKAPTQSTFQLPGEAVAAKLKAAREARLQKEAEEGQKKGTFKARPVPATLNKAPSVRPTAASKARESIMASRDTKSTTVASNAGHKRASTVSGIQTSAAKPRVPATTARTTALSSKPTSGDLTVPKRPATTLANTSKPRSSPSSSTAPTTSAASRSATNPGKGTVKGKEVFNRPAAAKAAAEKEKQEKEAAAKKARAEAAERGRQASREWAEKQKKLTAAKKAPAVVKADEVKIESSEVPEETVEATPQPEENISLGDVAVEPVEMP